MNRRGFLKGFVGAVAGAALAEELSTKSIFLPPRGGWPRINPYTGVMHENIVQAIGLPFNYVYGSGPEALEAYPKYVTEIPQFLTNYVDPQLFKVLLDSEDFLRSMEKLT